MQRKGRVNCIRYLTFSCYERLPLFGNAAIRDAFVPLLLETADRHIIVLHAWVVMPEHVHLLARPVEEPGIVPFLWELKRGFARRVICRWKELNAPVLSRITDKQGRARFWQRGGGYDRVIRGDVERATAYVHQNPVVRGLVKSAQEWKWSSLGWPRADGRPRTTAPREKE